MISKGISDGVFEKIDASNKSFEEKWRANPALLFDHQTLQDSGNLAWILRRNGWASLEEMRRDLGGARRILDAGCGNSRITNLLNGLAPATAEIVGIDINPEIAKNNLAGLPNVQIEKADLMGDLRHLGYFDFIYCQEVLHHTADPLISLGNLSKLLSPDGKLCFYVYKKKAVVREFTDDLLRRSYPNLNYTEALEFAKQVTELGKRLAEISLVVDIPGVDLLGIKEGKYPLHRFIYLNFLKCFWNPALSFQDNLALNQDWFHPAIASRHTIEEVKAWFEPCSLRCVYLSEDDFGITGHGVLN